MIQKISVPVICYNSSDTILDTLNSILTQDYDPQNIELIISDDCSTDDTTNIINEWLTQNNEAFDSVNFIKREKNLGIVKNMDDAYRNCKYDWIKFIAGDDILLENCISTYVSHISDNVDIIASQALIVDKDGIFLNETLPSIENIEKFNEMSSKEQIIQILKKYFIISPTFFISKRTLEEINFFSFNKRRYLEDVPFLIEALLKNKKLKIIETPLIKHRRGGLSSAKKPKSFYKTRRFDYEKEIRSVFSEYIFRKNIPFKARVICFKKYLNISKRLFFQFIKYYLP
ncbi:glycosyltransferase family 2 protein [Pseudofrancisella aestuarii]|uniref:Glycosyltransferase family 2 protein n=1 Tax=Pseudofrancisella aestuarii TaxID=2670347 RepID=A0ABV9TC11_9GAMM|nr:glycosyltransferase [Pseudofrancisella aestuarii]